MEDGPCEGVGGEMSCSAFHGASCRPAHGRACGARLAARASPDLEEGHAAIDRLVSSFARPVWEHAVRTSDDPRGDAILG